MAIIKGFIVQPTEEQLYLNKNFGWIRLQETSRELTLNLEEQAYVHPRNKILELKGVNWEESKPTTLFPAKYDTKTMKTEITGRKIDYEVYMQRTEGREEIKWFSRFRRK